MPAYLPLLLPLSPLQEVVAHWIAESRIAIEEIHLLTLKAAHTIDTLGNIGARKQVRPLVAAICQACSRFSLPLGTAGCVVPGWHSEAFLRFWFKYYRCMALALGKDFQDAMYLQRSFVVC